MNSTQIGILKQRNEISFNSLLQSANSTRLESQIGFKVLCDFTNETLEGEFADEKFS
jgi:hypothetical protein